jgi:uncharacterized protein (DUF1501 family)
MPSRRRFLRTSALTAGVLGTAPGWLLRAAAQGSSNRRILVVIFQRGAADGLNVVAPFFEPRYYQLRPSVNVPRPSTGAVNGSIDLDGRFALHPSLQPLKPLWDSGQLAIVHAAGSPDSSRSHFDAQEFMECGTPGVKREDGWLNRALPLASSNGSPMRAVALGNKMPRTLKGDRSALAVNDLSKFQFGDAATSGILERLYGQSADAGLKKQGSGIFEAARAMESIRQQPSTPPAGGQYLGEFGRRLQQVARLIKADVGVEVAFVDMDGWDHHANEMGQITNMLREFGTSLAAFSRDLGDKMAETVIVTMSEFGRTAAENGNGGTDHGHGGVMMVLGGPVRGGSMYGTWPGLEAEQLFEQRDLAVTTDFRDVLGELVRVHLGQKTDLVFPGYTVGKGLGLIKT